MDISDDSFAWSDASNDSDAMLLDVKQEENDSGLETDSKRKIQEESKKQNEQPKENKKKSKKRKHDELAEVNTSEVKLNYIKSEPDSDFEIPKKKKKKKHKKDVFDTQEFQESIDYDYINYRVKQEEKLFLEPKEVKLNKKKKLKTEAESFNSEENLNNEIDTDMTIEDNHKDIVKPEVTQEVEIKKKRKSKNNSHLSNDDCESDKNFEAKKKLKSKKKDKINNSDNQNISEISQIEEISCINSSTALNNFLDDEHITDNSFNINNVSTEMQSKKTSKSKCAKEIPKIINRLRFEDENSIHCEPNENTETISASKRLKEFLNTHRELSLIKPNAETDSIITEDDDITIVKVPHELNVKDLNMKLSTSSKLKFNGQTYDAVREDTLQKVPLLLFNKNKTFIKHFPVIGSINLHRRIPKAHIPEENVMINEQINFIPLPETKCRHPLLGADYKKAMKISPSIAERLNDSANLSIYENREKRKKHKKEKRKVEVESEPDTAQLDEADAASVVPSKKKRKRKSSIKDEPKPKKAKHIKLELESVDVWESEKAIEKNLFDF